MPHKFTQVQIRLTAENLKLLNQLRKHQRALLPDVEMSHNKQVNIILNHRLLKLLNDLEK